MCCQSHVVYLPGYQNEHVGCSESILVHEGFNLRRYIYASAIKCNFIKYAEHCDTPSIGSTTLQYYTPSDLYFIWRIIEYCDDLMFHKAPGLHALLGLHHPVAANAGSFTCRLGSLTVDCVVCRKFPPVRHGREHQTTASNATIYSKIIPASDINR